MSEQLKVDINNALETVRKLPAKKRLDAILEYPDQAELVKALTPQDLLLTIEEVGGEHALELIELLKPKQVKELFDFALWDNDTLDVEKTGHWLSLLFEANADRAIEQIDGLDIELLGFMFKLVADMYDVTLEEEPPETCELMSKSPDGRFIICFKDHDQYKGLARAMYNYIESLYGVDMKRALSFLEQVRFELSSGLLESSFRFRDARLLDWGILPRDERLAYFSTLSVGQLKKVALKPAIAIEAVHSSFPLMVQVEHLGEKYPFLEAALKD
ncbi:MAG TPA: DUF6178 family protein, partial [Myxococcota bacterium]|nr:DUF6178 family protein [Myxococcota bacterium]